MAIPNCQDVVERLSREYPQEWQQAHRGGAQTEAFIRRLAWVLHSTVNPNFGLLGQYGDPNRIADDVIMYLGEGTGVDAGTGLPQSGFDVIAGAGGPDPRPSWNLLSGAGAAIWVKPQPVGGSVGGVDPSPIEPPPPPAVDLSPVLAAIAALTNKVETVGDVAVRALSKASDAHYEALNAATRASEIKTAIENLPAPVAGVAPTYEGRFLGQRITFTPKG